MKFTKEEIRKSMLLYAVTDRAWLKENETLVSVCKAVLENGATFLQIREKDLDARTFAQEANALKELCAAYHVPFVVNDSVEIAINIDADGVHVGQSDIKGRDIRAMIGDDKILGNSAGTVAEAVAAEKAGADYIGDDEVVTKITKENWFEFDVVVATPDMMGVVGRLGRVLGPKGLMPNPKAGTVTPDVTKAVADIKAGKIEYRLDKNNIIHVPIGKASFSEEKLEENFNALMEAIVKAKPSTLKGQYLRSVTLAPTMGPGVKVNTVKF